MTATSTTSRDVDASAEPAVDTVSRSRANRRLGARIGWTWILLTSLGIAAFAVVPYLTAPLAESSGGLASSYDGRPLPVLVAFYVHVVGGGLALVLGPLQFWRGLRTRHPLVHRSIGRTYLVAVGAAAVAGLVLAPVNQAGLVGLVGFGTLAVLWLLTGWRGYRAIRARDVASHRAWMMRNFALTYSAVTLRIWLPLLIVAQIPFAGPDGFDAGAAFANAYAVVPFLAWLPNLVVAEWLIRRRGLPSYQPTAVVA
ncbi:DUF2306 domain-containing protein [Agromyces sp. NPDC056523]|uniref:DUF2306 domain-containing protein n=1 Tax=Agromyces sp. NPDC056523 TaxID=3345850 RepID=UPI0036712C53